MSIVVAATGEQIDADQFPASDAGMTRAVVWVARRTRGESGAMWVIEGVGSHGARLAAAAIDHGLTTASLPRWESRSSLATA